jgi:anti-sigma factor RsiW
VRSRTALSSHWTDDQLIAYLYGILSGGEQDSGHSHLDGCEECRCRLEAMQAVRSSLEREHVVETDLHPDLLAMQRRSIYASIDRNPGRIWQFRLRHWAVSACCFVVVTTGAWIWQHPSDLKQRGMLELQTARVTDEQLVEDASEVAERAEPKAAAPLQALFEN